MNPIVSLRRGDGSTRDIPLSTLAPALVLAGVPWRAVRSYRGQRHLPGLYWSSTTGAHVVYESRLELARLMLADADRTSSGSRRSRFWCVTASVVTCPISFLPALTAPSPSLTSSRRTVSTDPRDGGCLGMGEASISGPRLGARDLERGGSACALKREVPRWLQAVGASSGPISPQPPHRWIWRARTIAEAEAALAGRRHSRTAARWCCISCGRERCAWIYESSAEQQHQAGA